MGRQIRYFLSPSDFDDLETSLLVAGDCAVLHSRSRGPFPQVVESSSSEGDGRQWLFFYLARKSDLDAVVTKEIVTQGYWTIDSMISPVVEFSRCYFDGKILRQGRMYFTESYYDKNDQHIPKSQGFRSWAAALLKKAKGLQHHDNDLQAYLGREAILLRNEGVHLSQI